MHPRACGERSPLMKLERKAYGASPRMRGTAAACRAPCAGCRCIPAHAGNGLPAHVAAWRVSVHPRACGERVASGCLYAQPVGASPRMRGTGSRAHRAAQDQRCIPAHAGNGTHSVTCTASSTVHPRACGERHDSVVAVGQVGGASPRMRGTDPDAGASGSCRRCIPAHAGNGHDRSNPPSRRTVHPRACGERPPKVTRP